MNEPLPWLAFGLTVGSLGQPLTDPEGIRTGSGALGQAAVRLTVTALSYGPAGASLS